jgi:hypothetical protein
MRRLAVSIVAVIMALAVLPAAMPSSGQNPTGSQVAASTPTPIRGTSATPGSAEQFATQVLSEAPVPPGAQLWMGTAPTPLAEPIQAPADSDLTDLSELFSVDEPAGPPTEAMDGYVLAHLPTGSSYVGWQSGGARYGAAEATDFTVALPTTGSNEYLAWLLYATTAAPGGGYVLRIDSQTIWVPNPPAAEVIPRDVTADLTGYTRLSLSNPSSGPVSVQLSEVASSELAAAIDELPPAPQGMCMENALLYTIVFSPSGDATQSYEVTGWVCGQVVEVTEGGTSLPPLHDTQCALIGLVVSLLPATAVGTDDAALCSSP